MKHDMKSLKKLWFVFEIVTQQEKKNTPKKKNNKNKETTQTNKKLILETKQNFGIQGTLAHFNTNSSYEKYKAT